MAFCLQSTWNSGRFTNCSRIKQYIVTKKWLWNTFQIGWFLGTYSMQICCSTPETNLFHTISILMVLECANCQSYFNFLFRDILLRVNASSFPLINHFQNLRKTGHVTINTTFAIIQVKYSALIKRSRYIVLYVQK